jgi:Bacteriophage Lambda NinG protein
MIIKKIKTKLCRVCKELYQPIRPLQSVCSPNCAYTHAKTIRVKAERKEIKEAKVKLKSKAEWLKEAQAIFNQFIRLRDKDLPCISCQRFHTGQYHAGHYLTTGAHPELRFDEINVHKQCSACNNYLSGNIVEYRINLIIKIGIDAVNYLEGKHQPKHYTIEDIKTLKAIYKEKVKTLTTNII